MTQEEFTKQYSRLTNVHPSYYSSQEKMATIWSYVKDLDADWLRKLCDKIVLSTRPVGDQFDIGLGALAEKRAIKASELTNNIVRMSDYVNGISNDGLDKALKEAGLSSVSELFNKQNKRGS